MTTGERERTGTPPRLGEVADREAIRSLIASYFTATDERRRDVVLSLFTEDIRLAMHGAAVATGRTAVAAYLASGDAISQLGVAPGEIRSTYHLMGTQSIDVRGDEATAVTYSVAYLALDSGDGQLLVRGLRYLDELRRTPAGWRICDRIHTCDWSYCVPHAKAVGFAERVERPGARGSSGSIDEAR